MMVKFVVTPIVLVTLASFSCVPASPAGYVERKDSDSDFGLAEVQFFTEIPALTSAAILMKTQPVADRSLDVGNSVNNSPAGTLPAPRSRRSEVTPAISTQDVNFDGCTYDVDGVGQFKNFQSFTFESGLPSGLYASDYTVKDTESNERATWNHAFKPENVYSDGSFLNLRVPATTGDPSDYEDSAMPCAEITTGENQILYGSFRVNAIFSTVPGTCHGKPLAQRSHCQS